MIFTVGVSGVNLQGFLLVVTASTHNKRQQSAPAITLRTLLCPRSAQYVHFTGYPTPYAPFGSSLGLFSPASSIQKHDQFISKIISNFYLC
jgi:hypothetical protein